jgi:GNAT superfamily N-acetyltransferase
MRTAELTPPATGRHLGEIVISPLVPRDVDAVAAMIGRCSPATLYRRFHGVTRPSRAAPLLMAGAGKDSFGAWYGDECVAVGGLVPGKADDCNSPSGHIGVLVEDAWQRKGVGSALVAALVVRARQQGLAGIVADIQTESEFLRPMLGRIGPMSTSFGYGGYTICVNLAA